MALTALILLSVIVFPLSYSNSFLSTLVLVIFLCSILKMSFAMANSLVLFLTLEMIMLINFLLLTTSYTPLSLGGAFFMLFFSLAVCEASMGLVILVKLVRHNESAMLALLFHISLMKPLAFKAKIMNILV